MNNGYRARRLLMAGLLATISVAVTGCGGGGDGGKTTCSEYLALAKDGVDFTDPLSDEQQAVLQKMLRDHGKEDSELSMNVTNAGMQILQYCGVDDSGNRMHSNDAIENGVNLE